MTLGQSTFEDATRTAGGGETGILDMERERRQGQEREPASQQNVGETERYTSLAAGSVIALLGLARRDTLGLFLAGIGGALAYRGATGTCPMYSALGVNTTDDAAQREGRFARGVRVTQAFTIARSPEELYQRWRNLEGLPQIMTHLEAVRVLDEKRSHWVASAPSIVGGKVEWDAEITEDVPNERIAWRSLPGADVDTRGPVRFEASPRGTIIRVEMRYVAPAGKLGSWVATLFGQSPERQIREDLRNFKRAIEIGEPLTILGQPSGSCLGNEGQPYSENNSYLMPPTV
jgi:uncharacterized membrane protein